MKVKYLLLSMMVAAFLTSAISFDKKIEAGNKAPKIETIEGINVGVDANSEGKSTLVSFWSPKIPESRINNKNLSRKFGIDNGEKMDFISICTDSDENLMKEVLKIDGLEEITSYAYSEISPRVFKDYDAETNPRAFLISPQGKILEIM